MKFEMDLFGILVPTLLVWLVLTYAIGALVTLTLSRCGFYHLVWHRALFDVALHVCLLGGIVYFSSEILT